MSQGEKMSAKEYMQNLLGGNNGNDEEKKKGKRKKWSEQEIAEMLQELGLSNLGGQQAYGQGQGQGQGQRMQNYLGSMPAMQGLDAMDQYKLFFEPGKGYAPVGGPIYGGMPRSMPGMNPSANYVGQGVQGLPAGLQGLTMMPAGKAEGGDGAYAPTAIQMTYLASDGTVYCMSAMSPGGNQEQIAKNITDGLYNLMTSYTEGNRGKGGKEGYSGKGRSYGSKSSRSYKPD